MAPTNERRLTIKAANPKTVSRTLAMSASDIMPTLSTTSFHRRSAKKMVRQTYAPETIVEISRAPRRKPCSHSFTSKGIHGDMHQNEANPAKNHAITKAVFGSILNSFDFSFEPMEHPTGILRGKIPRQSE